MKKIIKWRSKSNILQMIIKMEMQNENDHKMKKWENTSGNENGNKVQNK